MIIKICGLREAENIRMVEQKAMPDWAGFIFYPKSKRYVTAPPAYLPQCKRIGVFVHPAWDNIEQRMAAFGLWGVQLHDADPAICQRTRQHGLHTIVAIPASGDLDLLTRPYLDCADYFLFDTPTDTYGGSGRCFNHDLLNTYHGSIPFLLSGGLNPNSVQAIQSISHKQFEGIDLNSGFEIAPALKDPDSLQEFVAQIRETT